MQLPWAYKWKNRGQERPINTRETTSKPSNQEAQFSTQSIYLKNEEKMLVLFFYKP